MKESRSCHTCQRQSYNLLKATCCHRICFHCVKSNKYSHKCASCLENKPKPRAFLSPPRNPSQQPKQKSTKLKDSESKVHSEYSPFPSPLPHSHLRSRNSLHRSSINHDENQDLVQPMAPTINCKEHKQPLSMYCKSSKQLICSTCLCNRSKYADVVPLKSAEDHLRKQNKLNKEQSKVILANIQNASKIITKNEDIFRNTLKNSLHLVQSFYQDIRQQAQALQSKVKQQLNAYFSSKMGEFHEIQTDLEYLTQILKEYKQSNKEDSTFSELLYLFSSFKVIKHTVKNLNLDYLPYSKDPQIIEISKGGIREILKQSIRLKLDLPLKIGQNRKAKSHSNKSVSRSKHEQWEQVQRGGFTGKMGKDQRGSMSNKHQMSLCSNIHGIEACEQERNMYKMLLKTKFKL